MVCTFLSCKPIKVNRVVPRTHLVPSDYGTLNMLSYSLAAVLLFYMQKNIISQKALKWQARSFSFFPLFLKEWKISVFQSGEQQPSCTSTVLSWIRYISSVLKKILLEK